ncbi:MAG TPA: hypothetical protein PLD23_12095 [Armatimonadota bacterium]|nr:hypothetical protein [Armatimonadota bacterium]HQK94243.1 hypothetical protein [Armatimonadota bacterium]
MIWGVISLVVLICIMCGALTLAKMSTPGDTEAAGRSGPASSEMPATPAVD